jgi:DNA polymerase III subunit delta'
VRVEEAFGLVQHALKAGRFAHAYVVEGPLRDEASALARQVLALLLCEQKPAPCGRCRACSQVANRTHPDVLWIEPQNKSRQIAVEQVRDIQARMVQTSFLGAWKACVLVGADRLGGEAANAFLKMLEEPPGRSVFLLLTDSPQFLLPTILSRCQRLAVGGEGAHQSLPEEWRGPLIDLLAGRTAPNPAVVGEVLSAMARAGRLAAMLKALKDLALKVERELAAEDTTEEESETLDARASARYREWRAEIMRTLLCWYRDRLLLVSGADPALVFHAADLAALRAQVQGTSPRQALRHVAVVEEMNRQMARNLPEPLVLSYGLERLR